MNKCYTVDTDYIDNQLNYNSLLGVKDLIVNDINKALYRNKNDLNDNIEITHESLEQTVQKKPIEEKSFNPFVDIYQDKQDWKIPVYELKNNQDLSILKSCKRSDLRMISDTILAKRSFSGDNELQQRNILEGKNIHPDIVSFNTKPENIMKGNTFDGNIRGRVALQRKPLTQSESTQTRILIRPQSSSLHQNVQNVNDIDGDEEENKENIYLQNSETLLIEEPKTSTAENNGSENIWLFSPNHYWNILFTNNQNHDFVHREDFHMLLYDYERLWNRTINH